MNTFRLMEKFNLYGVIPYFIGILTELTEL